MASEQGFRLVLALAVFQRFSFSRGLFADCPRPSHVPDRNSHVYRWLVTLP